MASLPALSIAFIGLWPATYNYVMMDAIVICKDVKFLYAFERWKALSAA